jgi:hypothetical protein
MSIAADADALLLAAAQEAFVAPRTAVHRAHLPRDHA